jgi:hypothetical protein
MTSCLLATPCHACPSALVCRRRSSSSALRITARSSSASVLRSRRAAARCTADTTALTCRRRAASSPARSLSPCATERGQRSDAGHGRNKQRRRVGRGRDAPRCARARRSRRRGGREATGGRAATTPTRRRWTWRRKRAPCSSARRPLAEGRRAPP